MIDVPDIELELLLPGNCVPAIDLRPAGDAWTRFVAAGLFRCIERQVLNQEGARADEAHFAGENEEEFRQFIERSRAEPLAERGESIGIKKQDAVRIASVGHGAEFDQLKSLGIQPRSFLVKEHRTAQLDPDDDREQKQDRPPKRGGDQNRKNVE